MSNLTGKTALVTGGTSGIGASICLRLANAGAKVVTNYRNEEKAKTWQTEAKKVGCDIAIYQADVSDFNACESLIGQIEQDWAPVDILVNNAGITKDAMFKKMSKAKWDSVMSINLDGLFNVTKPVVERMLERGWGRIINISSINGQKGQLGQTNYAASKAGVHGFTMSLAQELARKGITVNTVSPGYIETEMVMALPAKVRDSIIAQIPLQRLGRPDEVAALVNFLASEEAGFATGSDFSMNGGQHMM